ncbi:hypothetical protein JTB14_013026 [Gonioctena quinquepunctata]|nr:hypothetical protein JTB14_013026 [Gonioctena quinquepunctata]
MVTGHFNVDLLWCTSAFPNFKNIFESFGLIQGIDIVVNDTNITTDHLFINTTFTVTNYILVVFHIVLRNLKKINLEFFNRDLDVTPSCYIFDVDNIESTVEKLNELMISLFEKLASKHTLKGLLLILG